MSYLTLQNGIEDFSKAVISLWFRMPRETLATCADRADAHFIAAAGSDSGYVLPRLNAIVPLMTFGPMFDGYRIKTESGKKVTYTERNALYDAGSGYSLFPETRTIETHDGPVFTRFSQILSNPSFIGIQSTWQYDDNGNKTNFLDTFLVVRIQMENEGSGSWVYTRPHFTWGSYIILIGGNSAFGVQEDTAWLSNACTRSGVYPGGERITRTKTIDETTFMAKRNGPESLEGYFLTKDIDGNARTIEPDKWHHVLISFDLDHLMIGRGTSAKFDQPDCTVGEDRPNRTGPVETISVVENPCKMWIALDDINNADVSGWGNAHGMGPNDITTENCRAAAAAINTATAHNKIWQVTGLIHIDYQDTTFGMPTFSYRPGKIPSSGHPFGIPAVPQLLDSIYRVEMAEFQMFTGVTLDTASTTNRRAFIDEDGKPVKPKGTEDDLRAPAEKLLNKRPEILLHGNNNWQNGKNTGSLGGEMASDGTMTGQFVPTGGIEKYKPEPALTETPTA